MKKHLILALAAVLVFASFTPKKEARVFVKFVPERFDDFVFENKFIAGRFYGKALESCGKGQITSPGIDVWVKTPGAPVCEQRYLDYLQNGKSYHKDWGNGKDCYKVGKSLGAGASAVMIDGQICLPATNFRSYEIVKQTQKKAVFVLNYPEWEVKGVKVALRKTITVVSESYFCKVEDIYTFSDERGECLPVAAGVFRHVKDGTIVEELSAADRYAIWEHASDQNAEPEDGMIGVAVYVPNAEFTKITEHGDHGLVGRNIKSGESFVYYFGSCWSKGNLTAASDWFNIVKSLH